MGKSKTAPEPADTNEPTDEERIAKCRERYKRIKDLRSEMDRHANAAKSCKAQIDAALAEIEETVTKIDNQIPLPINAAAKTDETPE